MMTLNIPQEPFLTKIFQLWQESPKRTLIRDLSHDHHHQDHSVEEFLYDVSIVRQQLYDGMSVENQEQLRNPDTDVFIGVLASSEYAYAVFVFAIYCLGGVIVPMSPNLHPEEAKYFLQISDSILLMATPAYEQHAQAICDLVCDIKPFIFDSTAQPPENVSFSLDTKTPLIDPEKGFVVLLTSGTTGPAKGALHTRRSAAVGFSVQIAALGLTSNDTWLHFSPAHWMGGFMFFMINMLAGSCVEFCGSKMNHDWLLKRLQTNDSICMHLTPPFLDSMAEKLEKLKEETDPSVYTNAVQGLCRIRILVSGSMTVGASTQATWRGIRGGKPVTTLYGMTESLGMLAANAGHGDGCVHCPLTSAGVRLPHAVIKIDESGEIRAKTPALFKRYISSNADDTKIAFDSEGFYKTGDLGKLEDDILYVLGRASQDAIFARDYKIYTPEVEEALKGHPMISRSIVVGVSDRIYNQRIAALLVPRDTSTSQKSSPSLNLEALRKWLALDRGLNMYKIPSLLRIVGPDEDIPLTVTDKPIKSKIRDSFFNEAEIASGKVEVWDLAVIEEFGQRPFDWGGIQA